MKKYVGLLLLLTVLIATSCFQEASTSPKVVYKNSSNSAAVFTHDGTQVSGKEFYKGIENEIFELENKLYELKLERARGMVLEKLVKVEASKKKLTNDQWLNQEVVSKVKVSKKEIEEFIVERKIPKVHVNDQLKTRIKKYLVEEKKKGAITDWLDKRLAKSPLSLHFQKPDRPVFEIKVGDSPVMGKTSAPVTLVEFSDFQCPYCAKGSTLVHDLKKKYGDKIKVVFKNFPLDFHKQAKGAAVAGLCANEQGKNYFWQLHDHMFANQSKLADVDLIGAAAKFKGFDKNKFDNCMKEKKYLVQVENEIQEGREVGVKSTPTFFVNGKVINGAQPIEVFSELIDQELK